MLAAIMVKMSGSEKTTVSKNTYDIFSVKRVTRKFHVVVVLKKAKKCTKKCCTCNVAFLLRGCLHERRKILVPEKS